ncbi:MAG: aspartate kinase [Candidatus Aquidulcis sp.]|nr:MAG: aspartate kinase [Candidatus Aquidulcis sp.]
MLVQKYGGSSVGSVERIAAVVARIARDRAAGRDVVAVVSAMGDTTDDLLALASSVTGGALPNAREQDALLATGEIQSAALLAMALIARGTDAISLSGAQAGISADGTYGKGRIAGIEPKRVRAELDAGRVVIVAGFQGVSEGSETTTLGRGGSDTSAVALAAALGADRCQIFTDVRGVYTADPRAVPAAQQLSVVGYEEMLELANQGAQVMQTRAVELGWVNNVAIEVLSSFEEQPGTVIKEDTQVEKRNKVRGLAADTKVAKVTMVAVPDKPGIARSVFDPLSASNINVDMIVQNVSHDGTTDLSFTTSRADLAAARPVLEKIRAEIGARALEIDENVAKVSIVGAGIQNAPGYAARMFGTLADAKINIQMISTSEIRITCIVSESDAPRALQALHETFDLATPDAVDAE